MDDYKTLEKGLAETREAIQKLNSGSELTLVAVSRLLDQHSIMLRFVLEHSYEDFIEWCNEQLIDNFLDRH